MKYIKYIVIIIFTILLFFIAQHIYNLYLINSNTNEVNDNSKMNEDIKENNNLKKAKNFTLSTTDNRSISLTDYQDNSAVVLNFWASWCSPCREEMSHFDKLEKEYENVTFLMVNLSSVTETKTVVEKFLKNNNYSFKNILLDEEGEAASIYDIYSIPVTVFIDKYGNIVNTKLGRLDEKTLRNEIEKIIK